MKLIVGLGNIGQEYENTRHNIGFMVLDHFAQAHNVVFSDEANYESGSYRSAVLIKPTTYMNCSGKALTRILNKRSDWEDIIVIVDDIYLPLGTIRMREKGSDGGHNGLKSIAESIQSSDYKRIRIGVGVPDKKNLKDYVLSAFNEEEQMKLKKAIEFISELLDVYVHRDYQTMVNHYSKKKNTYSESLSLGIVRPKEDHK